MKVISSQRFIDWNIVEEKLESIKDMECIILPIINAEMKDLDGEDLYILVDGHHRKVAADELGIKVTFEEIENEEGLVGEDLLHSMYMDDNWYYVEDGNLVW